MSKGKLIPIGYDLDKHPDADEPDPVAWFEGTGEDIGLPDGFLEKHKAEHERLVAAEKARRAKEPKP